MNSSNLVDLHAPSGLAFASCSDGMGASLLVTNAARGGSPEMASMCQSGDAFNH